MNAAEQEAIERLEAAITDMWAMHGETIELGPEGDGGAALTMVQRINRCAEEVEAAN